MQALVGTDPTKLTIPAYRLGYAGSIYLFHGIVTSQDSELNSSALVEVRRNSCRTHDDMLKMSSSGYLGYASGKHRIARTQTTRASRRALQQFGHKTKVEHGTQGTVRRRMVYDTFFKGSSVAMTCIYTFLSFNAHIYIDGPLPTYLPIQVERIRLNRYWLRQDLCGRRSAGGDTACILQVTDICSRDKLWLNGKPVSIRITIGD